MERSVARNLALAALVAAVACVLALLLPPATASDDAAISFRYAERLAAGKGFTYNDHERVLGTSSPLYTLVLAVPVAAGAGAVGAAQAMGVMAYVAIAVLVFLLATRVAGRRAGFVAAAIVLGDPFFRDQALSGMEVGLAAVLGTAAITALAYDRDAIAGVLVGLAVWNKLDALALAVAALAAALILRRSFPRRFTMFAAATALPWFIWATWYFGSPLPQSMMTKLAGGEAAPFRPLWVLRFYLLYPQVCSLLLAPFAFLVLRHGRQALIVAGALGGWALVHGMAYSLVNLGAPYPWYIAMPVVPLAVLGGIATSAVKRSWVGAAAALVLAAALGGGAYATTRDWQARHTVPAWEAFDADRRMAGMFLNRYAAPGEVVEAAFGWPAFESRLPYNDNSMLNSIVFREPVRYRVEHGFPTTSGSTPPEAPVGMVALATFNLASSIAPGHSWFVVYGTPDSAIARSGKRALRFRLSELARSDGGDDATGIDVELPPPSDVSFELPDDSPDLAVRFRPELSGRGPASASVLADEHEVWTADVTEQPMQDVRVRLPRGARVLRLVTEESSGTVVLRDVEVLVGDAEVGEGLLGDSRLVEAWRQRRVP